MARTLVIGMVVVLGVLAALLAGGAGYISGVDDGQRVEALTNVLGAMQEAGVHDAHQEEVSIWDVLYKGALVVLALGVLLFVLRLINRRVLARPRQSEEETQCDE
jgi:flagellar biosynthesis/type III secretory pathway M-ring protein FliF/YscJ